MISGWPASTWLLAACAPLPAASPPIAATASRGSEQAVALSVGPWRLQGDLLIAPGAGSRPAALLLNKAAGDRRAYDSLAKELARRGVSSLRLDLRAHGQSINAGKFIPGTPDAAKILDGTEDDVAAALAFLQADRRIDPARLAVVGASYSAEAMAEEARRSGRYADAYVALSPGSFSEQSAAAIDPSGAKWLVTRSAREKSPAVKAAVDRVQSVSKRGEVWVLDAGTHATDVLAEGPEIEARIAGWIAAALR